MLTELGIWLVHILHHFSLLVDCCGTDWYAAISEIYQLSDVGNRFSPQVEVTLSEFKIFLNFCDLY